MTPCRSAWSSSGRRAIRARPSRAISSSPVRPSCGPAGVHLRGRGPGRRADLRRHLPGRRDDPRDRTSKGKGFQGVVKRHHFAGGDEAHGSMFHRPPDRSAPLLPSRVIRAAHGRTDGRRTHHRPQPEGLRSGQREQPPDGRGAVPDPTGATSSSRKANRGDHAQSSSHRQERKPDGRGRAAGRRVRRAGQRTSPLRSRPELRGQPAPGTATTRPGPKSADPTASLGGRRARAGPGRRHPQPHLRKGGTTFGPGPRITATPCPRKSRPAPCVRPWPPSRPTTPSSSWTAWP